MLIRASSSLGVARNFPQTSSIRLLRELSLNERMQDCVIGQVGAPICCSSDGVEQDAGPIAAGCQQIRRVGMGGLGQIRPVAEDIAGNRSTIVAGERDVAPPIEARGPSAI